MPLLPNEDLNQENFVIIYIWKTSFNNDKRIGHVAIKTPNHYISLWPIGSPTGLFKQFFETRGKDFMPNYEADKQAENDHDANTIIYLYSLNTKDIEEAFNDIKDKLEGWTLMRGTPLLRNSGAKESCASFALRLLNVGGFNELTKKRGLHFTSSITSSAMTPDEMAILAQKAKCRELKEFKQTKNFRADNETPTLANSPTCRIV